MMRPRDGDAYVFDKISHACCEVVADEINGKSVAEIEPTIAFNNN